ncbi:MAG: hypothetical protein LBV79_00770, partial [Candidatus Adiutrix sp.]|nr:hypothetical protein [Candidatus Adiutrix sp.]
DDIPILIAHFLQRFRESRGSECTGVEQAALNRLLSYGWPGNVRELENLIERMVTLADETVLTEEDLPVKLMEATEGLTPPDIATMAEAAPAPETQAAPIALVAAPLVAENPAPAEPSAGLPQAMAIAAPEDDAWTFPEDGLDFNALISAYEDRLIRGALEAAGGVKNKAAKLLGLNRTTLVEKMRKKGLTSEEG